VIGPDVCVGRPEVRPHPRYAGWVCVGFGLSPMTSPEWRDRLASEGRWEPDLRPVGVEPLVSTAHLWVVSRPEDVPAAVAAVGRCVARANTRPGSLGRGLGTAVLTSS
jgi:hypothetical protein